MPGLLDPILYRKRDLLAQEQAVMDASGYPAGGVIAQPAPAMTQAQFSGYPNGRTPMTPQQLAQLKLLLARQQALQAAQQPPQTVQTGGQ